MMKSSMPFLLLMMLLLCIGSLSASTSTSTSTITITITACSAFTVAASTKQSSRNKLKKQQVVALAMMRQTMTTTVVEKFHNNKNDVDEQVETRYAATISGPSSSSSSSSSSLLLSRRSMFQKSAATMLGLAPVVSVSPFSSTSWVARAVDSDNNDSPNSLESYLYRIIRVREATQQERRLISTGKFKDVQRANVKLAVKFMIQNYRLADSVVGAAAYVGGGNSQSMKAIDVGQTAVQNLQTILEYFDSQDVENIKVGSSGSMGGKEDIVVKGLQAAQLKIDEFLGFFPTETVNKVKAKIQEENELNVKEFDKSLGDIVNLPPPS